MSNSIARKAQTNLNIHKTAETVSAGSLLIHAWPDRVARARGEYGHFILSNGRGAQIDPSDKLAGEPWLVVADLQGQARNARITAACAITEQEVFDALADRIKIRTETYFDLEKRLLRQRQIRTLGAISLAERTLPVLHGSQADEGLIQAIKDHGISLLPWNAESSGFRACLAFLYDMEGQPYPDVRDAALLEQLENWLKPFLKGEANIASIAPSELVTGLKSLLPYDLQRKIDHIVPSHFTAPTGSRVPIAYHNGEAVLSIRVQELYGLQTHPTVGNSIPLTLELLSPARRPIQKTRDLVGFWRGSWSDVRSEMRGRYPKHPWPEDPASAMPTNKVKPRAK